ncbi:nucleoporin NUP42 [Gastrophryne carolinensis]
MAICSFFLQGRCRYGDRCWNEHPRGGGRHQEQQRYQQPPQGYRGGQSNQRYVQPSNFSKSTTWTRNDNRPSFNSSGDHRSRDFSGRHSYSQNRFSTLSSQDHSRDTQQDNDGNLLEEIQRDLEVWQSSGQWIYSVYCPLKEKQNVTGFADISPEELRLEYLKALSTGNAQNYVIDVFMNSIQQLQGRWKQRLQEIQNLNPASHAALKIIDFLLVTQNKFVNAEINNLTQPITAPMPAFGGQQNSGFGANPSDISFSFKADSQNTGSVSSFSNAPGFGSTSTSGFGTGATGSAASFSFAQTANSGGAVSGLGNSGAVSAASFSFASVAPSGVGSSNFSSSSAAQPMGTTSIFTGGFGGATTNSAFGGSSGAPTFGGASAGAPTFGGASAGAPTFGGASAGAPTFGGASAGAPTFGGASAGAPTFGGAGAPVLGGASTGVPAFGGASSTSGFGTFSNNAGTTGFGAKPTVSDSFKTGTASSTFGATGQVAGVSVSQTQSPITAGSVSVDAGNDNPLFTPRSALSAEDLPQFQSTKFTWGKIPQLPPPVDLLMV